MARPRSAAATKSSAFGHANAVGLISILDSEQFLPARRYASADTSYSPVSVRVCLSVCLSQVEVLNESSWFLARELPSTYPALCY